MYILTAKNVTKSFLVQGDKKNQILNNISFSVEYGKITSLVGASGVGKSTLLYLLGALDTASSGEITLNLTNSSTKEKIFYDYNKMTPNELAYFRNKHIGFVFQFHHLLPEFNVLENIMLPALISGASNSIAKTKALELIEQVNITHIIKQYPNEISGGEAQRAAIARALINSPSIVMADEPTGNLDSENTKNIMQLISKLNISAGITFLIATHSKEVASMSHYIIKMKDGKIISDAAPTIQTEFN